MKSKACSKYKNVEAKKKEYERTGNYTRIIYMQQTADNVCLAYQFNPTSFVSAARSSEKRLLGVLRHKETSDHETVNMVYAVYVLFYQNKDKEAIAFTMDNSTAIMVYSEFVFLNCHEVNTRFKLADNFYCQVENSISMQLCKTATIIIFLKRVKVLK